MGSAEEINRTAEGLKNEGDEENLLKLARENGIDAAFEPISPNISNISRTPFPPDHSRIRRLFNAFLLFRDI